MTDDKKVFGKGFDVEITSFKELRSQAEAFDFNFYRKRMIGNLPKSIHQTCVSLHEGMVRFIGGKSLFIGKGKITFDKTMDISSITSVGMKKNWDIWDLILGCIFIFLSILLLLNSEFIPGLITLAIGSIELYTARGMELFFHFTTDEIISFQTWNQGEEQELIQMLRQINPHIEESSNSKNSNFEIPAFVKTPDFWKNNIIAIIMALLAHGIMIKEVIEKNGNMMVVLVFIIITPIPLFTSIGGWKIGQKFKEAFAPDGLIYSKTSTLIKWKLFWRFGPQIIGSFLGAVLPPALLLVLFGIQL